MAKAIMVQGTASNAGKSLLVTGLCRLFSQAGYRTAPFKSQNMALNSYITREGHEMGRAQVVQAQAAGMEPSVLMNPILLKPTGAAVSQVIVNGQVWDTLGAAEYHRRKGELRPAVESAYKALSRQTEIVVIEGAGSPAEINLAQGDFVNMGMAAIAKAPVLLVGDIDRGGVFASLYGTVKLLPPEEQARIRGIIINKFRGDVELLRPGLRQLEELLGIPVLGVIPYLEVDLEAEDSLSEKLQIREKTRPVDVAVIRLPHISNFTDFDAMTLHPAIGVRYVEAPGQLGRPDLLILPGTKNTMSDLLWMRQNGLEGVVKKLAEAKTPIIGICGGYQMLGEALEDPEGVEYGGKIRGMELLPVRTRFEREKQRTRVSGSINEIDGFFSILAGIDFEGYEIHMGCTERAGLAVSSFSVVKTGDTVHEEGAVSAHILGSYIHGLFDGGEIVSRLAQKLLEEKGLSRESVEPVSLDQYREVQFMRLEKALGQALDMEEIFRIVGV